MENQNPEENPEEELENETANFNYTDNFRSLRKYEESDCQIKIIEIPEPLQIEMCFTEQCSVSMNRFNVAYSLEEKRRSYYKTKGKELSDEKKERHIIKYGYHYYKKYYEPREEWWRRQRLHNWMFRQIEYEIRIAPKQVKHEEYELESQSSGDESDVSELNINDIDLELEQFARGSLMNSEEVPFSQMSIYDSENFFENIAITSTQNH